MNYLYEIYRKGDTLRLATADSFEEVEKDFSLTAPVGRYNFSDHFIVIHHLGDPGRVPDVLSIREDLENARVGKERAAAWHPEPPVQALERRLREAKIDFPDRRAAVDKTMSAPGQSTAYYKDTVPGMMYAEMMQYMLVGKDPFEAAMLAHIFKYLFRVGKKEGVKASRDYRGALWYLNFLIAYIENDRKPIKASAVENLVGKK